jgi:hypothetical protein
MSTQAVLYLLLKLQIFSKNVQLLDDLILELKLIVASLTRVTELGEPLTVVAVDRWNPVIYVFLKHHREKVHNLGATSVGKAEDPFVYELLAHVRAPSVRVNIGNSLGQELTT